LTYYYSILSRGVASLNQNTAEARAALFERARNLLIEQIEKDRERWSNDAALAEVTNFDAATDRIEAEVARRAGFKRDERNQRVARQPSPPPDLEPPEPKRGVSRIVLFGGAGLLGALLLVVAIYAFRGQQAAAPPSTAKAPIGGGVAKAPEASKTASSRPLAGDDLEPGVDGGSTETGLPYHLRRQAVYYRTVYSPGMVVVDRSQRFLYVVEPQARAWRYGIGVGGECDVSPGLYRIKNKSSRWPDWSPSPALLKRRSYPPRVAGGPGNPWGAYVLYFENEVPGIHGTNAPKSIGQAPILGCFRLVNDDVIDLEKRIAVGTGVVVLN